MRTGLVVALIATAASACSAPFESSAGTPTLVSVVDYAPTPRSSATTLSSSTTETSTGWQLLGHRALPMDTNGWTFVGLGDDLAAWGPGGLFIVDVATQRWRTSAGAPPIGWRIDATTIWTGKELIIWGGYDAAAGIPATGAVYPTAGAAYNPATDTWRTIAKAPIETRTSAIAAWDGVDMFIWGGWREDGASQTSTAFPLPTRRQLDDSAAYNLATDTWRTLASTPPPGHIETTQIVSGSPPVAWVDVPDSTVATYGSTNILYSYDKSADMWTAQPKSPLTGWSPTATATAQPFVAIGVTLDTDKQQADVTAVSWTENLGWETLPAPPLDSTAVCQTQALAIDDQLILRRCATISVLRDRQWVALPDTTNSATLIVAGHWLISLDNSAIDRLLLNS